MQAISVSNIKMVLFGYTREGYKYSNTEEPHENLSYTYCLWLVLTFTWQSVVGSDILNEVLLAIAEL